jgi:hypothetical protein
MKTAALGVCALFGAGEAMSMPADKTGLLQLPAASFLAMEGSGACKGGMSKQECASAIAGEIVSKSKKCFAESPENEAIYKSCVKDFCKTQCGKSQESCKGMCVDHANPLFARLAAAQPKSEAVADSDDTAHMDKAQLEARNKELAHEQEDAMTELQQAQQRMVNLNGRMKARAEEDMKKGDTAKAKEEMAKVQQLDNVQDQINSHLANVQAFTTVAQREMHQSGMGLLQKKAPSFLQMKAPEDELAKEMTHDLEMNFNKIAPFGKEDTAKELQDHAAKTQDTLVDAVENAEVAEIKRAVFRALTRLRAATIKEFDTIARLETQAIDAYNDAHHYRAENPLAHLHEDEAPVETDKLKSFH